MCFDKKYQGTLLPLDFWMMHVRHQRYQNAVKRQYCSGVHLADALVKGSCKPQNARTTRCLLTGNHGNDHEPAKYPSKPLLLVSDFDDGERSHCQPPKRSQKPLARSAILLWLRLERSGARKRTRHSDNFFSVT
jgi:hypothetical protein